MTENRLLDKTYRSRLRITPPKVATRVSWALLGNACTVFFKGATIAIVAKILTPSALGDYSLALALTSPLFLLLGFELRNVLVTDAAREYRLSQYLTLRMKGMSLALILASALVVSLADLRSSAGIVLSVALSKVVYGILEICYASLQRDRHQKIIAKTQILDAMFSFIVFASILKMTNSLVAATLTSTLPTIFVTTAVGIRIMKTKYGPPERTKLKMMLKQGLRMDEPSRKLLTKAMPLSIAAGLLSLNLVLPGYILAWQNDTATLGVFTAMSYLLLAGKTLLSSMGQVALPKMAELYRIRDERSFRKLVLVLCGVALAIGVAGAMAAAAAGEKFLTVLYTPEYAQYNGVLVALAVGGIVAFLGTAIDVAALATREFTIQLKVNLIRLVILAAVGILAIPQWGLYGAALTIATGNLVQLLVVGSFLYKHTIVLAEGENVPITRGKGKSPQPPLENSQPASARE